MNNHLMVIGCLSAALLLPAQCRSETVPLWEAGIGVGTIFLPDYRGADHTSFYTLPFPYFSYNGRLLKVNRSGIQGKLFGTDRVLLNLSLAAGVPVSSRVNGVRAGMPNLDPTIELGPSLDISLWRDSSADRSLWLRIPARAVFSLSINDSAQQGWFFSPYLDLHLAGHGSLKQWEFNVAMGPMFADSA